MFLAVYEAEVGPQTGEAPDRRASRARQLTLALACAMAGWLGATGTPALAQTAVTTSASANPELILEAQDALRQKNRARLSALNVAAQELNHPLAPWVDYWQLGLRLAEASQSELDAFYARWPGSYVEDRLRNDCLLELGRRRDWKNFANDHTRYQMRDDREVVCYALLTEHFNGRPVARESARAAWLAQRDAGEGCGLLASTWLDNKQFSQADIWLKLRLSLESLKLPAARQAASLLGKQTVAFMTADHTGTRAGRTPGLGFGLGLILATLAGLLEFASTSGPSYAFLMIAVVFGLGQLIESLFLTPRLVGERIGLHPLAVIFALLAFGQLFGFVGVLIALPASAVLLVAVNVPVRRSTPFSSGYWRTG